MGLLDGRVTLISGTGRGQGRAAAIRFAEEGAKVVGCDINSEGAEDTMRVVHAAGGEMVSFTVDLSVEDGARTWIEGAVEAYGGIDVLYNNAGAPRFGAFAEQTLDDWYFTIRNELDVVHLPTRLAWRHLIARGGGSIISTSSMAAIRGFSSPQAAHAAAKGAIAAMMTSLAVEGAPYGIRTNTIMPGMIENPDAEPWMKDPSHPIHRNAARILLGRIGKPSEVANLALFLASDESSYMTGATIVIDGGITAWS